MILIDSGPSPRGWSRLSKALRCPLLHHWHATGRLGDPAGPLVRGSIGHVGLAHLYAYWNLAGANLSHYPPGRAMALVAEKFGLLGEHFRDPVTAVIKEYAAAHAHERLEVLGIEELVEGTIGGYPYTARVDLKIRAPDGRIQFLDHKIVGSIRGDRIAQRYSFSGQFYGLYHLGSQRYGDEFGGVAVNVIGMDGKFQRATLNLSGFLLERFPETVRRAEAIIARPEAPGGIIAPTVSEHTCQTPYGFCEAIDLCRTGGDLEAP